MATIEVRRPGDIAGGFRQVIVTLDGRRVAGLRRGQSATVNVPPGRHELQGRMDWVKTAPLALDGDDSVRKVYEFSLPFSLDGLRRNGMKLRQL